MAPIFVIAGAWVLFLGWDIAGLTGLLFPGAIGWLAWLGAAIAWFRIWRRKGLLRRLKRRGVPVAVIPKGVAVNYGLRVNGRNPWRLTCQAVAPPEFAGQQFVTSDLWQDPTSMMVGRPAIRVYADPKHPRRYAFDLLELGLAAQPPGTQQFRVVLGGIGLIFALIAAGMLIVRDYSQVLPERWQSALQTTRATIVSHGATLGTWSLSINDCGGDLEDEDDPSLLLGKNGSGRQIVFTRSSDQPGWIVKFRTDDQRRTMVFPGDTCRISKDLRKDGPRYGAGWSGSVVIDCSAGGQVLRGTVAARGCE